MKIIQRLLYKIGAKPGTVTRIAVKNAWWQFLSNIVMKIGGLLFTVIIARILMPELFGLYSLVMTILGITLILADAGVNSTFIRYASFYLGKNKKNIAKQYSAFLFRIKVILTLVFAVIIVAIALPLQQFFTKPIATALMFGSIYLLAYSLTGFFLAFFDALNEFKYKFIQQVIFQPARVLFSSLAAIVAIRYNTAVESIIIALSIAALMPFFYLFSVIRKRYKFILPAAKPKISAKKRKEIYSFIINLTFVGLSGVIFGQIDTIMLGKFVEAEWLGYYKAAFSLFFGVVGLLSIHAVFYPIFSRYARDKQKLNKMVKKANKMLLAIALLGFILLEVFAYPAVLLLFGKAYMNALLLVRLLAIMIFAVFLIPIQVQYYSAIKKPEMIAKMLSIAMTLNIILNYIFIKWLLSYSQMHAVIGAALATIISRYVYLCLLAIGKRID